MSNIGHLKNQILAISVATVLVYAVGIAIPTLTATPAFATHYDNKNKHDDNNKHYDNKNKHDDNNKHYDNKNYDYKSQFLNDVEQCFPDNGNHDEQFSDDVKECIYDVIAAYFDHDTNNNSYNDDSNTGSTSTSTSTSNGNRNDNDDSNTGRSSTSTSTSNGNRLGMGNGIGSLLSS